MNKIIIQGSLSMVVGEVNECLNNGFQLAGDLQLETKQTGKDESNQAKMIIPWYLQPMIESTQESKGISLYQIVIGSDEDGDNIEKYLHPYLEKGYQPTGTLHKADINVGLDFNNTKIKKLITTYAQVLTLNITDLVIKKINEKNEQFNKSGLKEIPIPLVATDFDVPITNKQIYPIVLQLQNSGLIKAEESITRVWHIKPGHQTLSVEDVSKSRESTVT